MVDAPISTPPGERTGRTLLVAVVVAFVCATVVSTVAVALRPLQRENRQRERLSSLKGVLDALPGMEELLLAGRDTEVTSMAIDLETGAPDPSIDAAQFDAVAAARDPLRSVAIPSALDVADLERRARHAVVHVVREGRGGDARVAYVILPVEGVGYGGPIRAYLALAGIGSGATVAALHVYEQQETAGLGSKIAERPFLERFRGKRVFDDAGLPRLGVAIEGIDPADAPYLVDGITGATVSSDAVGNLLRYWCSDHGYGPFLRTLSGAAPGAR